MKSKKLLLITLVLCAFASSNAYATNGSKQPPPMQKTVSTTSWYDYLLSPFSFF